MIVVLLEYAVTGSAGVVSTEANGGDVSGVTAAVVVVVLLLVVMVLSLG